MSIKTLLSSIFHVEKNDEHDRYYILGVKVLSYKPKSKQQTKIKNNGVGNIIELYSAIHPELEIEIYGNNNTIIIETTDWLKARIEIGLPDCPVENCTVKIGSGTRANGVHIALFEDSSSVIIHKDCLFSWGITIWCSDSHSILDATGQVINIGNKIEIFEHVWVGMYATILKNTIISRDCIIGAYSIITKKYTEPNCIIAGNPAAIVKRDINWDVRRPKQLLNSKKEK